MTSDMQTAYSALLAYTEGSAYESEGETWFDVYLDNAKPSAWSGKKWSGVLSQLQQAGVYIRNDDPDFEGIFGRVLK